MRNFCLSMLMTLALGATVLFSTPAVVAQSAPEPAVVVSLAPMSEQLDDLKYLVKAAGYGNMNFFIQSQVKHFTSGIDRDRPSGAMLFFNEDDPMPKWLGFVAVEELDDLLDRIADFADVDEGDDFITIIPQDGQEILVKNIDGYLYVADSADMFQMIPDAPLETLGDLPTQFNLAVRLFGQRIPVALRQQVMGKIWDGYQQQLETLDQVEEAVLDDQMEQLKSLVNETDEVLIGFNADKESGVLQAKLRVLGTPGSVMAKRCNVTKELPKSRFAGFLNADSAFNASMLAKLLPEDIQSYQRLLDQLLEQAIGEVDADGELSDEEIAKLETMAGELIEVIKETVATGEIEAAGVVMLEKSSMNFASGFKIADPQRLEKSVKSLIEMVQEQAGAAIDVKFNSSTYDGINFHSINVSIPEDEEEMQKVVGDRLQILIGIGKEEVYFGAGKSPLETLTASIDQSKTAAQLDELNQYNFYLAPILRFSVPLTNEAPIIIELAEALEESGRDRISSRTKAIENGFESRFEMEDGFLGLISGLGKAAQAGVFQGNVDEF